MRKTPKKVIGLFGLVLVAAMTVFAASLPSPNAEAVGTSSVTDSIVVTVLPPAYVANVSFLDHTEDIPYINPNQNINFNYSGVEQVKITLEYTNKSGATSSYVVHDQSVNPDGNTETLALDLSNYGYGRYEVKLEGSGQYGSAQDIIKFSYVSVTATVEEDEDTGKIYTILDYDENSADVDHFVINVYDENGNLVDALSPIIVNKPNKKIEMPFAEKNVPAGKYTVSISAIDPNGNLLYDAWDVVFVYDPMLVPNTGGLFAGLNISKVDYLVTGLIAFGMVGIFGIWFILKDRKSSKRR